jgi:hypothetical protein
MTDLLQCRTCIELTPQEERTLQSYPLTLDPEAKGYTCEAGHFFTIDQVAVSLPDPESPLKIVKRNPGRPKGTGKKHTTHLSAVGDKTAKNAAPKEDKTRVQVTFDTPEIQADPLPETVNDVANYLTNEKMPNGDLVIPIRIREPYIECFREEAATQNRSLQEHLQERIDWWMENDIVVPAPVA